MERNNKRNKHKKRKIFLNLNNSWLFVILASIVDMVFMIHLPGGGGGVPIFDLSNSMGSLGKKRQEKLLYVSVSLFLIALIGIIIVAIVI